MEDILVRMDSHDLIAPVVLAVLAVGGAIVAGPIVFITSWAGLRQRRIEADLIRSLAEQGMSPAEIESVLLTWKKIQGFPGDADKDASPDAPFLRRKRCMPARKPAAESA